MLNTRLGRSRLPWRREKQYLPAYVLIAAKGRVRLAAPKDPTSKPSPKEGSALPGARTITCGNCTVGEFVKMLGHPDGRFVFDETGRPTAIPPPPAPPLDQGPPVLSVALDRQHGLKLEKKQRPVDVIVIDRIPVPN